MQRLKRPNYLIIGLGNPGREYEKTRHNAGFLLCESLAEHLHFPPFRADGRFCGDYSEGDYSGKRITLFRPMTFMNRSGEAVRPLVEFFKLDLSRILVCHDDLDLPLGKIRFQLNGGTGGHRGVESIVSHLGSRGFPRLRIGIGRPVNNSDVKKYVLERFPQSELRHFEKVLQLAKNGVLCFVEKGIHQAMNAFNGRLVEP